MMIDFFTRDTRVYGFPYHHLINYMLEANPELERDRNAPPERMTMWFASHDVIILGSHLEPLLEFLHEAKIATVRAYDARYANFKEAVPFISEISVAPAKDA